MKYEEEIKRILPKIFKEFFHRYPHLQVFYEHDNLLINNDLIDELFVEKAITTDTVDYVELYFENKRSKRGVRDVYAISLQNHYYIANFVLRYYIEINHNVFMQHKYDLLYESNFIDTLFLYKREYGLSISAAEDFIVRDIKDFYPSLSIKDYASKFPKDKLGLFSQIEQYYNSLYERAAVDFGLLQAPWYSWILADMFLLNIDRALEKAKIKFFRDGDSYYFAKDDIDKDKLIKMDEVFDAFGMKYTEYQKTTQKTVLKTFLAGMYRFKNKSLKFIFPIRIAIKEIHDRRFDIARILKNQIPSKISKVKLARKLLEIKTWDDFELYHIIHWAIDSKINISFYYSSLLEKYQTANSFLRAQIRLLFLIENEEELFKKVLQNGDKNTYGMIDYDQHKDILNAKH